MKAFLEAIMARALLVPMVAGVWVISLCAGAVWHVYRRFRPARRPDDGRINVAVIATFYNANWCKAHLTPIALAPNVAKVTAVVEGPTADIPGVTYVFAPPAMTKVFGRIISKAILLFKVSLATRADVTVGYFLIPNGLAALVVAGLLGRSAVYQNTVGPTEIIGGGVLTDNKILVKLKRRSWLLERLVFATVRRFDAVIVRGSRGIDYLRTRRLTQRPRAMVGSVDCERFSVGTEDRCYDLITVARLVEIKQPQRILDVVKLLSKNRPGVSAVIVGDGPLLPALRRQAADMGIEANVSFLGQVDGVERLLQRSRVFILTSKMEGLSIALAEAMACGVPAVVSDVGELGELVDNGATGWRVQPDDTEGFAARVTELLESQEVWGRYSERARRRAVDHNGLSSVARQWGTLLGAVTGHGCEGSEPPLQARTCVL